MNFSWGITRAGLISSKSSKLATTLMQIPSPFFHPLVIPLTWDFLIVLSTVSSDSCGSRSPINYAGPITFSKTHDTGQTFTHAPSSLDQPFLMIYLISWSLDHR